MILRLFEYEEWLDHGGRTWKPKDEFGDGGGERGERGEREPVG